MLPSTSLPTCHTAPLHFTCVQEDKKKLHIEDLKETGTVWEATCQQVNAQPVSPTQPSPATGSGDGAESSSVDITLNSPPSPFPQDGSSGEDESSESSPAESCSPALPARAANVCLVGELARSHGIHMYQARQAFKCKHC